MMATYGVVNDEGSTVTRLTNSNAILHQQIANLQNEVEELERENHKLRKKCEKFRSKIQKTKERVGFLENIIGLQLKKIEVLSHPRYWVDCSYELSSSSKGCSNTFTITGDNQTKPYDQSE